MALSLLAANNAQTVLAAGISSSATTLTVNTGTGSLFPSPSAGVSFFKLTLIDAATGQISEIIHVNARSGDTMTIERGQEGTTARAWSANDIAANMMTAGTLSYILGNFQPLDATLTAIADLATSANKLAYFTGTDAAALTDITSIGRSVIGQSSIANLLAYLGLGTAATKNIGTGANQVPDMNSFNGYKGGSVTNGWQALPSGLIIQWYTGTHPGDSTAWSYNFPIPFPNAFLGDTAVVAGATNNRSYINGSTSSNTSRSWIVTKDNPSAGGPVSLTSIAFGW